MFIQECYCAQYKGPELADSTSGGVFFVFAKYFIEKGGCAFGAAYDKNLVLRHIVAERVQDLKKIQGSKYVESDFVNILPELKKRLDNGQLCLFSGTPCQIAAAQAFLKRYYSNLLLIDILCHGTPSRVLFQKYIAWREKLWNEKILNYEFRNKRASQWGAEQKALVTTDKGVKIIPSICDPYFAAFQKGLIAQNKCYSCKYASPNRVGDVTAADFWGIQQIKSDFPYKSGASCLLVNTPKGKLFFDKIQEMFLLEKIPFEYARKYNPHFNKPLSKTDIQKTIYSIIKKEESFFSDVLPFIPHKSYVGYLLHRTICFTKYIVKKLLRMC